MTNYNRAIVVLNGETCNFDFFDTDFIISCDGALNYLKAINKTPNIILGDFDSLGYIPENALKYPAEKDFTDGELALEYCIEHNFSQVVFICGGGKREDHFLGNLSLMIKADNHGIKSIMETRYSTIYIASKPIAFNNLKVGVTFSVIPLEKSIISKQIGLKYDYHKPLEVDTTFGVSNVVLDANVSLDITNGRVLIFINKTNE